MPGPYGRVGVQRESLLRLVALWAGGGGGLGRGLPLAFGSMSGSRAVRRGVGLRGEAARLLHSKFYPPAFGMNTVTSARPPRSLPRSGAPQHLLYCVDAGALALGRAATGRARVGVPRVRRESTMWTDLRTLSTSVSLTLGEPILETVPPRPFWHLEIGSRPRDNKLFTLAPRARVRTVRYESQDRR